MHKLTILAEAQLGTADAESIRIVYVQPDDIPASVVIHWPMRPTTTGPRDFPRVAAMLTSVFASAATRLAGLKAKK